jgi:hypothetical protein
VSRKEGMAKMKIAYKIRTLIIVEAENYYPTCKGRNLNCSLTIENKVIGHAKVYSSSFTGIFKIKKQPSQGGKDLRI